MKLSGCLTFQEIGRENNDSKMPKLQVMIGVTLKLLQLESRF